MEKFSATISTEKLKAKAKNANTTKSTSQWLLVCLSWTELRNRARNWSLADWTRFCSSFMQKWKGKMTLTTNHHPLQICKLLLDRRLRESGYIYSLLTSRHFLNSKNVFGERLDF